MKLPPEGDRLIAMLHGGPALLSALETLLERIRLADPSRYSYRTLQELLLELTLFAEDLGTTASDLDDAFRARMLQPED